MPERKKRLVGSLNLLLSIYPKGQMHKTYQKKSQVKDTKILWKPLVTELFCQKV